MTTGEKIAGEKIAEEARRWAKIKVPYQHRGTTIKGCDCTGFLIGVLQSLGFFRGYKLPYYSFDWSMHRNSSENIIKELNDYAYEVHKSDLTIGDVLLFKFARTHSHAGIYLGNHIFAHCYQAASRCCLGVLKNSMWEKRWTKVFRLDESKI